MSFVRASRSLVRRAARGGGRLRKIVEEQKLEVIRLSFPDQHGILRGKTLVAGEALASLESGCTITTTMFAKDTSHKTRVSGVHLRRRLRHEGDGRRRRRADGARPLEFSRAAVVARHGLAVVRCLFRRRAAGAVRDPQPLQVGARKARPARLRLRRRPGSRIPHLQARRRKNVAGACRPARHAARRQPALARLSVSRPSSATTRWSRCWKSSGATSWRSACPCVRSRSSSARASANSPSIPAKASSPPTP